jgi:DNA-binding NtrC family response regulator
MFDYTYLVVTRDRSFVALLREQLRAEKLAGTRLILCDSADEACALLQTVRVRLVVVHLEPDHIGYEEVDHILWVTSIMPRRMPVLVVAERYVVEQATNLFRMGVSDFVSRSHHAERLGALVAGYLSRPHRVAEPAKAETEIAAKPPARVAASGKAARVRAGTI